MSMDRKNKKAAQQQNQTSNSNGGGVSKNDKDGRRDRAGGPGKTAKDRSTASVLTTRLTVTGSVSRLPMVISKATISPSAPAPALRDADFGPHVQSKEGQIEGDVANYSDKEEEGSSPAQHKSPWSLETASASATGAVPPKLNNDEFPSLTPAKAQPPATPEPRKPSPLPLSTPSAPRGYNRPNGLDFGPVGSPPRSSPMTATHPSSPANPFGQARTGGLSPGTSPTRNPTIQPASPFSAPVSQTIFPGGISDRDVPTLNDLPPRTLLGSSLGVGGMFSGTRPWDIRGLNGRQPPGEVEEDDIEDFLPSSLNELLTPAEMKRRESRSTGLRPNMSDIASQHKHSRSVPALSLMDTIWTEGRLNSAQDSVGSFAPSSFSGGDGFSPNLHGTSNVSAGFLSNLHSIRPGVTHRSVSDTHAIPPLSGTPTKSSMLASTLR